MQDSERTFVTFVFVGRRLARLGGGGRGGGCSTRTRTPTRARSRSRLPVRRDAQLVLQPVVIGQVLADPAHCVSVVYRRQLCNTHTHIFKTNV